MEHDSDLENNESGSDLDSTHSSQGIDRWWMKSQKNVFILSCTLFWDIILGRKFVMVVHDSYEWINMLEKCRHLDLIVFHLIWVCNRHISQFKKSKSWGPFWSYQLNSTANPTNLPENLGQMNWIGSAPGSYKRTPGFWFFQLPWVPNLHFSWNSLLYGGLHFSCIIIHL